MEDIPVVVDIPAGNLARTNIHKRTYSESMYKKLLKPKLKARDSYIARLTGKPDQPRFTIIGSGCWSARASGAAALTLPSIARASEQLDPRQQLANTPPSRSTTLGLHPVSIHQMAQPERTSDCSLLLIYRPRKDERLSYQFITQCKSRLWSHDVQKSRCALIRRAANINQPTENQPAFNTCMDGNINSSLALSRILQLINTTWTR